MSMLLQKSGDASKFDGIMNTIFNELLDDNGHTYTARKETSLFSQKPLDRDSIYTSEVYSYRDKLYDDLEAKKEEAGIKDPMLIKGDTLFLNFDSFVIFNEDDDGAYLTNDNETSCSYIKLANDYIQAHDDEINNVVINLTTNGGGYDEAELYTSSWICGKAYQHAVGPMANHAKEVGEYVADVNMDEVYDEKDNIADKNVYLLTSNYSFSNANVLPGELKGKENVTLIGQKTGGGSCNTVGFLGPLGNTYHFSSMTRATNDKWESIELGVEPDIVLEDPLLTCDYDYLLEHYIHQ